MSTVPVRPSRRAALVAVVAALSLTGTAATLSADHASTAAGSALTASAPADSDTGTASFYGRRYCWRSGGRRICRYRRSYSSAAV